MKLSSRIALGVSAAAFGLVTVLAGPATALDVNYAPGLPPAEAGVPNNPPAAEPVTKTVETVSAKEAANATPEEFKKAPATEIGEAPKKRVSVGDPVALTTTSLTPGAQYVVYVKRNGGAYGTLGSMKASADGSGALPVFKTAKSGTYTVAMVNVQTGETVYYKVRATA